MTGDAASGRKFGRSLRCLFVVVLIPITWLIAGADLPTVRTSTGFQFARLRYPGGIPYHIKNWYTDYPGMDEHFTRLLGRMTGIQTGDAVVLEPSSPDIFKYPLLYTVEPEQMVLRQTDIANLAEYLARGGLWFADDFHGNEEFDLFWEQIQRVLPESSLVELDISHPIFHCFYDIPKIVQVTNDGIAKCRQCEQWETVPPARSRRCSQCWINGSG